MSQAPPPPPPPPASGPADAAQKVSGPGIALLIVGIVDIAFAVLGILLHMFGATLGALANQEAGHALARAMGTGRGLIFAFIGLGLSVFITYGALQLRKLKAWNLSLAASIVAMIPCLTPCLGFVLGIPIGIWCIVVLVKPEVKAAFR